VGIHADITMLPGLVNVYRKRTGKSPKIVGTSTTNKLCYLFSIANCKRFLEATPFKNAPNAEWSMQLSSSINAGLHLSGKAGFTSKDCETYMGMGH
jgi:hypothetical protein